jgi:aldehyde dehydrogenase (NAD+)
MTVTADHATDLDRTRFFIDGQWVDPLGSETHHALEAATGE